AALPGGQGSWPAFWMLSIDHLKGTSPSRVELDIIETQGNRPTEIFTTVHSYASGSKTINKNNYTKNVDDWTQGFHTYGMAWDEKNIKFYYDGNLVQTVPTPADAHKDMYLIVNLALGDMIGSNYVDSRTPDRLEMK